MSSSDIGLPGKIASFVDKNGDTLQNMALLAYLKKGEEAKPFLETVTTAKVSAKVWPNFPSLSLIRELPSRAS